jgi:mannitol/fructose-specific phosphotransferase system IIA component (Ntr-type)
MTSSSLRRLLRSTITTPFSASLVNEQHICYYVAVAAFIAEREQTATSAWRASPEFAMPHTRHDVTRMPSFNTPLLKFASKSE